MVFKTLMMVLVLVLVLFSQYFNLHNTHIYNEYDDEYASWRESGHLLTLREEGETGRGEGEQVSAEKSQHGSLFSA